MTTVKLTIGELEKIIELVKTIPQIEDRTTVLITQSENSGIGTTITATFRISHHEQKGDFVVTITDFNDW